MSTLGNLIVPDMTALELQPGGSLQSQLVGVAICKEVLRGPYELCVTDPQYGFNQPHWDFPSLWVYGRNPIRGRNGIGILNLEYRGLDPSLSQPPAPVYSMQRTTAQQPIDTNPNFKDKIGGTKAKPLNGAKFDDKTGIFLGFSGDSIYAGLTSYLNAGEVWTKEYTSYNSPTSGDLSNVGFISTPEGNAPTPSSGSFNWLYTGCNFSQQGGIYKIQKSWLLSGADGWDEETYRKK